MNVVWFPSRLPQPRPWTVAELNDIQAACGAALAVGDASHWETGETEAGDPQFHLMGASPDHDCILSISRLEKLYVLEDGRGGVVLTHSRLATVVERVRRQLSRHRSAILVRLGLLWLAAREVFEEKVEPVLAESGELLVHVAPQLAVCA